MELAAGVVLLFHPVRRPLATSPRNQSRGHGPGIAITILEDIPWPGAFLACPAVRF